MLGKKEIRIKERSLLTIKKRMKRKKNYLDRTS